MTLHRVLPSVVFASVLLGGATYADTIYVPGGDAIVPVAQDREISVLVETDDCGSESASDAARGLDSWSSSISVRVDCPDDTTGEAEAAQNSVVSPVELSVSGLADGSTFDPDQTCTPVSADAGSSYNFTFELTRYAAVTIVAEVSVDGLDGSAGAGVRFGEIIDLFVSTSSGGKQANAAENVFLGAGVYTLMASAGGGGATNCCCSGGIGEFDVSLIVHPCGDVTFDGMVDTKDLLTVLGSWGSCPPPRDPCPGDANGDGVVDVANILAVLANWS